MKLHILIILISLSITGGYAQIKKGAQSPKPKSAKETPQQDSYEFKPRTIVEIQSFLKSRFNLNLTVEHDEFRNISFVASKPSIFGLYGHEDFFGNPTFIVMYPFEGVVLNKPAPGYMLQITVNSSNIILSKLNDLYFLADEYRVAVGRGSHSVELAKKGFTEQVAYSIKASDLLILAKAKNVRFKVGLYEGELDNETIGIFQVLLMATQ